MRVSGIDSSRESSFSSLSAVHVARGSGTDSWRTVYPCSPLWSLARFGRILAAAHLHHSFALGPLRATVTHCQRADATERTPRLCLTPTPALTTTDHVACHPLVCVLQCDVVSSNTSRLIGRPLCRAEGPRPLASLAMFVAHYTLPPTMATS